jgi:hypothetical protein
MAYCAPKRHQVLFIVALVLLGFGCTSTINDYGRRAEYKIQFASDSADNANIRVHETNEDKLKEIVRPTLINEGLKEEDFGPGRAHWSKQGATVEIYQDRLDGGLILEIDAFGGEQDLQISIQIEQELIALLKQERSVTVTHL